MKAFLSSFVYAWTGIVYACKKERNLKIHLFAAATVLLAAAFTGLSAVEWLVIILLIGGMISLEMINTAIEHVVDLVTKEIHPLAKYAKDVAAGAVLVYAIVSAIIGLLIFLPKWYDYL